MSRILNPGDWARDALQLEKTPLEYDIWLAAMNHPEGPRRHLVAEQDGLAPNFQFERFRSAHFWLIEGHRVLVYVTKDKNQSQSFNESASKAGLEVIS